MMRIRGYVLFSLCLALAALPAWAQPHVESTSSLVTQSRALAEAATARPLHLNDAVAEALRANADLGARRLSVDPLRSVVSQARSLPPPMVEGEVWQWPIDTFNPAKANMFMWTASQQLPGRGKREAAAALAEADVRVGEAAVVSGERDVARDVTSAYWDLYIARRALVIHLASVDLLHQTTDVAQARYASGGGTQGDVLKAVVEITRLHQDVIDLERAARLSAVRLNSLLNRPTDLPVGPLDEPVVQTLQATVDDLEQLALERQPDLQTTSRTVDRANAQLTVANRSGTPDWSVGGGYMLLPQQTDAWVARASVTWPHAPWSRRGTSARVAEAQASLTAAQAADEAKHVQIRTAVATTYADLDASDERASLLRTTLLPQSVQMIETSRIAYQTGRGDLASVIDAERLALDAQLTYARTLVDWQQAFADLVRAIGAGLPATMMATPIAAPEVSR